MSSRKLLVEDHPPTLVPRTVKEQARQKQSYQLELSEIRQMEQLDKLANLNIEDLLEDTQMVSAEEQAHFLPVPKAERADNSNRRHSDAQTEHLVHKLKEYKSKLKEIREKHLELAKTSFERNKEIEHLKYEQSVLQEELKQRQLPEQSGMGGFALITKKGKNKEEEQRRHNIQRDLFLGAFNIEGNLFDYVGKSQKSLTGCKMFIQRVGKVLSHLELLKSDMKKIESYYDKSISAYFAFYKFLVNTGVVVLAVFGYLLIQHLLSASDLGEICASGVPCWVFYSSFESDEAFWYSLSLAVASIFIMATGLAKWTRTDLMKKRADVYGNGTFKKFSAMVFNSWDWSINTFDGTAEHVARLSNLISTALKDKARQEAVASRTQAEKNKIRTKKILGSAVYVLLLATGWFLITLLVISEKDFRNSFSAESEAVSFMISLIPKLGVSLVNAMFPNLIIKLTILEQWDDPALMVKLQIVKMHLAKMLNVVLFAVLNLELATNGSWFSSNSQIDYNESYRCREDQAGFNLALLVLSEALLSKIIPLAFAGMKKVLKKPKKEIKVAQQVINSIYFQSLLWITFPFFPYIALFAPFLLYADFKFQYWRLRNLQIKPQEQTQASDLVIFIVRVYNITMMVGLAYIIYFLSQSLTHLTYNGNNCGCFANNSIAHDAVIEEIKDVSVLDWVWTLVSDSAQFLWILCIALIMKISFTRNHLKVILQYIQDRDEEFELQLREHTNMIKKLQKQIDLNKKIIKH